MNYAYKQFLNVLDIYSESIRTWLDAYNKNTFFGKTKAIPIPVPVKKLCAIAILAFAITSCGDNRTTDQQRSPDMQTMGTDETFLEERETADTIPGVGAERVVEMEAKDHVYFPREISAKPGEQFYVNLVNGGNEPHNIHIELSQAPITFGDPLPVGQSRKLLVSAPTQPGRYQIFCPVKDHRERGMIATLIVE